MLLTSVTYDGRACLLLLPVGEAGDAPPIPDVGAVRNRKDKAFFWQVVPDCSGLMDAGSSGWQLPLVEEDRKDAEAQASPSVLERHHQLPHVGSCSLLRILLWS